MPYANTKRAFVHDFGPGAGNLTVEVPAGSLCHWHDENKLWYFNISTGLRGCYMADSAYIVRCNTRRELRAIIADEAGGYRDAGFIGANQRAISYIAAIAWRC